MLGERLAAARKHAGLSQFQLAVKLGDRYDRSMIGHVEHNRSALLFDGAVNAARELDVSLDYLAGLTDNPTPSAQLAERIAALESAPTVTAAEAEGQTAMRPVAVMELAAAAGSGAVIDENQVCGYVWFTRQWLDRRALDPTACRIIRVAGESMEPTLPEGCAILVNRAQCRRRKDRLVVVCTEDGLIVKRLGKNPAGGWLLISDHPDKQAWPTKPWPAAAEVVGEVVWVAKSLV